MSGRRSGRVVIGITCDTHQRAPGDAERGAWRYELSPEYGRAVAAAGGVAVMLGFERERIGDYLDLCDGFILSGGDDPDTRAFGEPVHAKARLMRPERQLFELELLRALEVAEDRGVLGVCLGMQMMALHAGGRLHQHLPEAAGLEAAAALHDQREHTVRCVVSPHRWLAARGRVWSHHNQAVADAGRMRVAAVSEGEAGRVIEAIDRGDGERRFYLGVQWHPERTAAEALGWGLIRRFVESCGGR